MQSAAGVSTAGISGLSDILSIPRGEVAEWLKAAPC